jgi:hypothetical protein
MSLPTTPRVPGMWANERAAERLRLERNVQRATKLFHEYGGHGYEVDLHMAIAALERFEDLHGDTP